MPLDCLERDWFTVFGRNDFDVTNIEMAVADTSSGLTRLLVSVSDWDGNSVRNSKLAYVDYETCEQLFFIRQETQYQPGLVSLAIYTDDINGITKTSETLYQVGKAGDSSQIIVTRIEENQYDTFTFDLSELEYLTIDALEEYNSRCSLEVIDTNVLLWTHPLGSMVIDLDLKYVRSLYYSSDENLSTILTTTSSNRYLNAFSVESITDENNKLWVKTYDFNTLYFSKVTPTLTMNYSFDLGT